MIDDISPATATIPPEQMHFTGRAGEYFKIWIVNLLLTIITLGLYSPWAKVRRLQYFYRHTEVAGSSFDFHGSPVRILIGRLIAVATLIVYQITVQLKSPLTLVMIVLIAALLPWLLRNSLRFRLYNTSWRATRFHFRGTVRSAYRVFLLNGILTVITLYILAPFMHHRLKRYQHDNTWFGTTRCSFHAGLGQFYKIYLLLFGAGIVLIGTVLGVGAPMMAAMVEAQQEGTPPDPSSILGFVAILYGVALLLGVSIYPTFRALITNLIWNNTRVGEHRIACHLGVGRLVWITFTNFFAVVLSLGFLLPWAAIRLAHYQMSCMQLLPASDLQQFTAAEPEDVGAVGEEASSIFDFDIGL